MEKCIIFMSRKTQYHKDVSSSLIINSEQFQAKCNRIFFFFSFGCVVHGILVPQPGIEPVPPAVGAQSLNQELVRLDRQGISCNKIFYGT